MRLWTTLFATALLALPALAGGENLAGNWKISIYEDGKYLNFWLLKLQTKDGKLTGEVENLARIPPTSLTKVQVDGDLLNLQLKIEGGPTFTFEGKLPKAGGKRIYGSLAQGGGRVPAFFELTPAKDAMEADLEILNRTPNDPRVFLTLLSLIPRAAEKKIPARDVQEWVDGVVKTAESYGPAWQNDYNMKLLTALAPGYPTLAVETAGKIEKSFDAKTPIDVRLRLLTELAAAHAALKQDAEAAAVNARIAKIEVEAKTESEKDLLNFKITPYAGKVGQPVLVELFTGAQCPPCVAADIGFDGLGKAFKESEISLLQYHLHIPGPDALTNADTEARMEYYAKTFEGTPAIYFNGKPSQTGGGTKDMGGDLYGEYRTIVDKLIQREPGGKLTLAATRKGDEITIATQFAADANVKGNLRLRLALVEDWARYKGRNGLIFHHRIVRAMPGGPAGFVVDRSLSKSLTVDVAELRTRLGKYLDNVAKSEGPFLDAQRPMRLEDLHVVAFVQNDDTQEVIQSMSVPVK
jgi:hypothetical protein